MLWRRVLLGLALSQTLGGSGEGREGSRDVKKSGRGGRAAGLLATLALSWLLATLALSWLLCLLFIHPRAPNLIGLRSPGTMPA